MPGRAPFPNLQIFKKICIANLRTRVRIKMIQNQIQKAHRDLWKWCRRQDFAGYDPFDGLNSHLFQSLPFKSSRPARLAWTQLFKRLPVNLRTPARVPRQRNAKGIALFTLSALADYRRSATKESEVEARELVDDLMAKGLKGFSGAAWGYNFDWQGRAFFAPRNTPAIVPTAFASRALIEASLVLDSEEHLRFARTVCDFILNDLNRSEETKDEVCFSYSPLDHTRVFNASLLAAEVLASVGKLTKEGSLCDTAMRAARYVIRHQRQDGSWPYGIDDYQSWSDNFHTAFILTSLSRIIEACDSARDEFEPALVRGCESWKERFFLSNGWPKYYPDHLYPADTHSAAAAIVALVELRGRIPGAMDLAERITNWTMENLRDRSGFFYYQRRRFHTVRIPYMRWSQAWMAYALARLLEANGERVNG